MYDSYWGNFELHYLNNLGESSYDFEQRVHKCHQRDFSNARINFNIYQIINEKDRGHANIVQ